MRVACQKSVPKLGCKVSRVLMMDVNGYLKDNSGYGIFKHSGIPVRICMQFIKQYVIVLSKMCLYISEDLSDY